jgi:hypothetical protein
MEALLNVDEAAKLLRMSPWTVRKYVAKKRFMPSVSAGECLLNAMRSAGS